MKRIMLVATAIALTLLVAIGGTVAYLADTDSDVNVMTMGNVYIEQHEYQRVVNADGTFKTETIDNQTSYVLEDYEQAKPILPSAIVTNSADWDWDDTTVRMTQVGSYGGMQVFLPNSNAQDKFVTVENTGKTDAYVRTLVAFEAGSTDGSLVSSSYHSTWAKNAIGIITVDGNNYYLIEYLYCGAQLSDGSWRHEKGILSAGDTTYPNLSQVYLHASATNDDCKAIDGNGNGTLDILVFSQAVQAAGFENAEAALDAAFGDITTTAHPWATEAPSIPAVVDNATDLLAAVNAGKDIYLTGDINHQSTGGGYGVADIKVNGTTFDGKDNTLNVSAPTSTQDYSAISTTGGTIKNLTIEEGFRGIFLENLTEDVYLDNVKLGGDEVCYCINTGANDGNYSLYVTNSTINGWTSFSNLKSASFTNCDFGQGTYYNNVVGRLAKPYVNTTFTNCTFINEFYLDLSALEVGCKVTLENCTVNGVVITAANCETVSLETGAMFDIELPAGRTLADCVIFK